MINIKVKSINYYNAIGWCISNTKGKWTSDPLNHTISFFNSKDALICSMKFQ